MFVLFNIIFAVVAMTFDNVLGTTFELYGQSVGYGWIYLLYCLAIILPGLAVCVRRLHDIGKSGWYYLIAFIPLIGFIVLIIWFCQNSQIGENKWGANPKE